MLQEIHQHDIVVGVLNLPKAFKAFQSLLDICLIDARLEGDLLDTGLIYAEHVRLLVCQQVDEKQFFGDAAIFDEGIRPDGGGHAAEFAHSSILNLPT